MYTTQPWQVFAWTATRYGELYTYIASAFLTREGASVEVAITTKSWRQIWNKAEAIDLVTSHLRRGEWAPVLTMWLGDGEAKREEVLSGEYKLVISAREP
jgi:SH3-like domain-containing protein